MFRITTVLTTALLFVSAGVIADETAPDSAAVADGAATAAETATAEEASAASDEGEGPAPPELTYQTGRIVLPNKAATLELGEKYRYLDPQQTETMLVAWGNPPGSETLGAVVPASLSPFDDGGWAVIVTYIDDGHVDDEDAQKIDYAEMLEEMQEGTRSANEARQDAGYGSVELLGWAEQPHYDQSARKLFWAKELKFDGGEINTLNYDVRVLGREGVLSLNAVAGMPQIEMVRTDMQDLLTMASFNEGYRYEDFNEKTDKVAAYGIGALVAGGLAAKAGLFAKLGALLIAFKKFIIIGVVALGGLLMKLFRRKSDSPMPT